MNDLPDIIANRKYAIASSRGGPHQVVARPPRGAEQAGDAVAPVKVLPPPASALRVARYPALGGATKANPAPHSSMATNEFGADSLAVWHQLASNSSLLISVPRGKMLECLKRISIRGRASRLRVRPHRQRRTAEVPGNAPHKPRRTCVDCCCIES